MKCVDADKLKELIDEKWKELADKNVKVGGGKWDAEISTYLSVLRLIDSLQQEQTEVDLEKEIDMFVDGWSIDEDLGLVDDEGWSVTVGDIKNVARHFYELGLKARKEE